MGIKDLRLAGDCEKDPRKISVTAPNLEDAVDNLPRFETAQEALKDGSFVVGFTARKRRGRRASLNLNGLELALKEQLSKVNGKILLVFGREDFGLPNDVLDLCHAYVTIDTDPQHHSINLAQAVLLGAFTVRGLSKKLSASPLHQPPYNNSILSGDLERLVEDADKALQAIDFFKFDGAQKNVLRMLRDIFRRSDLDKRELSMLRGLFSEVCSSQFKKEN